MKKVKAKIAKRAVRRREYAVNGHIARSGYEVAVCKDLAARRVKYEYEPDSLAIQLPVVGGECTECGARGPYIAKNAVYTVDLWLANGRYVELKGKLTSKDRTRLKALYKAWAGKFPRPLSLLFQKDNFTTKKHKERYSGWARKIGFEVAVGTSIPVEWTI